MRKTNCLILVIVIMLLLVVMLVSCNNITKHEYNTIHYSMNGTMVQKSIKSFRLIENNIIEITTTDGEYIMINSLSWYLTK